MATHASRDTSTGLTFEQQVSAHRKDGIDISKTKLKKFLTEKGVKNPTEYLSWMFQPDEAYYIPETNEVVIYEKKFQQTSGSADEKLGACAWKIQEYKRCFEAAGINKVSYIYILHFLIYFHFNLFNKSSTSLNLLLSLTKLISLL